MPRQPRILFFGTSEFAVPTLRTLFRAGFFIAAVFTKPDARVGRKQLLTPPPVKSEALKLGLHVAQPWKLEPELVKRQKADIGVVVAYGAIISRSVLSLPRFGFVNLHPSLLPKYRGPSPIQSAIRDGEDATGVTIMQLDSGVDTGPIYAQERIAIRSSETAQTLHDTCADRGAHLMAASLPEIFAGTLALRQQVHSQSTITKMLTREDGRIHWKDDAHCIERMIRAYTPWPGAWAMIGQERVKILEANVVEDNARPGEVALSGNGLVVGCGAGALAIKKLQRAGKKPMSADEFIRGLHDDLPTAH